MARLLSDASVTLLSKLLVSILFVLWLVAAFLQFREGGLAAVPGGIASLVVIGTVAFGVFTDSLDEPPVQLVLALGLVLFGIRSFGSSPIAAGLVLVGGGVLALGQLVRLVRTRG